MTGRTGYTELDNGLPPEGPDQMNGIFEHFDALIGESYATAGALPPSGNWDGRMAKVRSDRSIRLWDAAAGQWQIVVELGSSWVNVTPESDYYNVVANGSWPALATRKTGQTVEMSGHISTDGSTGSDSTFAFITAAHRPERNTSVLVRPLAAGTFTFAAHVTPAGALVLRSNISTGAAQLVVHGTWLRAS